jgi:hypothetical protein
MLVRWRRNIPRFKFHMNHKSPAIQEPNYIFFSHSFIYMKPAPPIPQPTKESNRQETSRSLGHRSIKYPSGKIYENFGEGKQKPTSEKPRKANTKSNRNDNDILHNETIQSNKKSTSVSPKRLELAMDTSWEKLDPLHVSRHSIESRSNRHGLPWGNGDIGFNGGHHLRLNRV